MTYTKLDRAHPARIQQRTAPLQPAPRPIKTAFAVELAKQPLPPQRVVRIVQHLAPLIPQPRPVQTNIDRREPHPFNGHVAAWSALTPDAKPPVRPLQARLDRADPQPFRGRHLSASAIAALRAVPRPLQTELVHVVPFPPGRHTATSAIAPLRPPPRAIQAYMDRRRAQLFNGTSRLTSALTPFAKPPVRPLAVTLDRQEPKPFAGRRLTFRAPAPVATAAVKAVRPLQAVLTRLTPPVVRHLAASALAPLRPTPRPVQAITDRFEPKPFAGHHVSLSTLTPFAKPPVRPLQSVLDRGEPKPFSGRRIVFPAPAPAVPGALQPRPVVTVLQLAAALAKGVRLAPEAPAPAGPIPFVPRPAQTRLTRYVPYPAGRIARILQRLAPLIPVPRPLQTVLDRNEPKPGPAAVRRRSALTPPLPPVLPAVRAIQALLDRGQPKPFSGRSRRTSALTPFAKPPVRPLQVYLDRFEPKPFGGHHSAFPRPALLAPIHFVGLPIAVTRKADPITWRVPVRNGGIIEIRPPKLPVPPIVPITDSGPGMIGAMTTTLEGQPTSGMIGAMTEVMEGKPRP